MLSKASGAFFVVWQTTYWRVNKNLLPKAFFRDILNPDMIALHLILIVGLTVLAVGGVISKLWLIAVAVLALDLFVWAYARFYKNRAKNNKKKARKSLLAVAPCPEKLVLPQQPPSLPHVDETFFMSGVQFEQYVAEIYSSLGYKVQIVGGSGDQGIDIIASKLFRKIGIQAKCYNKPVSNKAVMEAAAGKKYYRLSHAVVVTNSIFTNSAVTLAKKCNVTLIDKRALSQMVKKIHERT